MFGKRSRPTGNYRFRFRSEPQDPRRLDPVRSVPPSLKQLRRRRWTMTVILAQCLAITAGVIALISFAIHVWHDSISANPVFAVSNFNFETNVSSERGGLTRETILEVTKLRPDLNVMSVDLRALQSALEALPQVQEAAVQRYFPNRIDIRVSERQPVAWLGCAPRDIVPNDSVKGRLLDAHGVVFECHSVLNQYQHLPTIDIPSLTSVEVGRPLADPRALQAIQLLDEFSRQIWCVPLRIKEVKVDNEYSLEILLTDGTMVTFGIDEPEKQVKRLSRIYLWAKEHDKIVATAKLIAEHNTPVTFVSRQQAAPAPTPKPPPAVSSNHRNTRDAADIKAIIRGH